VDGVHFKAAYDEGRYSSWVFWQKPGPGLYGGHPLPAGHNSQGKSSTFYGPNEETAGIGKKIEEEPFITQIIGLTPPTPSKLGRDIDAISGATESSAGMAQSLRDTMDKFAANFLDG
jgi:hypothetical protein